VKGLDLSEAYYSRYGEPMIRDRFAPFADRIAAGMVGPGSECFGFDDEISRDHDWGPGFCMWLTGETFAEIGGELEEAYRELPPEFEGRGPRIASPGEEDRVGATTVTRFYKKYTNLDHPPADLREWLSLSDQMLATCTNGRVFRDPAGLFTEWRDQLLRYYPEDVRLKKIASRCITIAQSGQYNLERSLRRGEVFAARYAETQFCADVISLVFLLNRRYPPFYKWLHRAVKGLPLLGETIHRLVGDILSQEEDRHPRRLIERTCALLIGEMKRQDLTDSDSGFLLDHATRVHEKISDPVLSEKLFVIR
jgi:hypothetical protein